ncbi:NfeD family protein [Actinomycetospora flava]|uniref:NfeD family protein n=1 Tax=Actinomycetospora flava TaxID=3129232 RepID=A0ABU8MFI9_9PSEU
MAAWVVWLIVSAALGVAEALTLTAAAGLLGGSALVAAGAAAIGLPLVAQLLVFAMAAVLGLVLLRPVAARHLLGAQTERFGVDALLGRPALVIDEVTGHGGTVRISGETWTARAVDESVPIPAGATVDVVRIDGVTAIVYRSE